MIQESEKSIKRKKDQRLTSRSRLWRIIASNAIFFFFLVVPKIFKNIVFLQKSNKSVPLRCIVLYYIVLLQDDRNNQISIKLNQLVHDILSKVRQWEWTMWLYKISFDFYFVLFLAPPD